MVDRRRFLILFNGRCGGTLVQRSLDRHPNAVCKPELLQSIDEFDEQVAFLEKDSYSHLDDPAIQAAGAIVKLAAFRAADYSRLRDYVNSNDVSVIHLYRENPIKHALSGYVADVLRERIRDVHIYQDEDRVTPLHVDFDKFLVHHRYFVEYERRLFCFVEGIRHFARLNYESLLEDPAERMLEIQSWLGLPLHANLLDPMKKIVPDDLRDAIHNYDEFSTNVRAMLMDYPMGKDTPMAWCLDAAVVPVG